jgi:hypothetical protein
MAHFWTRSSSGSWSTVKVADGQQVPVCASEHAPSGPLPIVRLTGARGGWALLAAPGTGVRINGRRLPQGVRVLRDRDSVQWGANPKMYFSTESLATVTPFRAGERTAYCARCKQPVEDGTPSVACPTCSALYHETEPKPCFTYAPHCALCPQSTSADAGYNWTPADL